MQIPDFPDLLFGQFCFRIRDAVNLSTMSDPILTVLDCRSPLEIIETIIERIPVQVATLHPFRTRTDKGFEDQQMEVSPVRFPLVVTHPDLSVFSRRSRFCFQIGMPTPVLEAATDSPPIRDLVSEEAWNGTERLSRMIDGHGPCLRMVCVRWCPAGGQIPVGCPSILPKSRSEFNYLGIFPHTAHRSPWPKTFDGSRSRPPGWRPRSGWTAGRRGGPPSRGPDRRPRHQ
jgi:hypothetical protein